MSSSLAFPLLHFSSQLDAVRLMFVCLYIVSSCKSFCSSLPIAYLVLLAAYTMFFASSIHCKLMVDTSVCDVVMISHLFDMEGNQYNKGGVIRANVFHRGLL